MSLKSRFHLPEGHYFLSHSVGAMPKGCEAAASEFLGAWKHQAVTPGLCGSRGLSSFCSNLRL